MSFSDVLNRYAGSAFSIYNGDLSIVDEVRRYGTVISWYVGDKNEITDIVNMPERIIQLVVTTDGYVQGVRVETSALSYLESADAVIYHGYPNFVNAGMDVDVEVYAGGCVVTKLQAQSYRLNRLAKIIPKAPKISSPFKYDSNMDVLLPYIHIISRLEEDLKETRSLRIPVDNIPDPYVDPEESANLASSSSVYVDKERKLLVAAIDLAVKANTKDFVLVYYGDLYIRWLPHFLSLFAYLNPTIHLWGRDQGIELPASRNVHVRPQELGRERPDISLYLQRYGNDNKILILADEDASDLLDINPLYAYIPYDGNTDRGSIGVLPWSTIGRANLFYERGNDSLQESVSEESINYFHQRVRTNSYNMGAVINKEMGSHLSIGRELIMPALGLCTCFDCASEVSVMCRYMKSRNIPYSQKTLEGLLTSNGPSLWEITKPISRPSDRKTLSLTSANIDDILNIDIYSYGNIGVDVNSDLIETSTSLYLEGTGSALKRLREVLNGERYPLVVNFHRDFVGTYSEERDKGRAGKKVYDDFIQSVALNKSSMDTYGVLLLFILRSAKVV